MQKYALHRRPNSPTIDTSKKAIVFNNRVFVIVVDKEHLVIAGIAVADIAQWHGIPWV